MNVAGWILDHEAFALGTETAAAARELKAAIAHLGS